MSTNTSPVQTFTFQTEYIPPQQIWYPSVTIQTIFPTECIGDSLAKINSNFTQLQTAGYNSFTALASAVSAISEILPLRGPQGLQGVQGPRGLPGTPGATIVGPRGPQGPIGKVSLKTENDVIGEWGVVAFQDPFLTSQDPRNPDILNVSLRETFVVRGKDGETGIQGEMGPPGPPGPQGPQGEPGNVVIKHNNAALGSTASNSVQALNFLEPFGVKVRGSEATVTVRELFNWGDQTTNDVVHPININALKSRVCFVDGSFDLLASSSASAFVLGKHFGLKIKGNELTPLKDCLSIGESMTFTIYKLNNATNWSLNYVQLDDYVIPFKSIKWQGGINVNYANSLNRVDLTLFRLAEPWQAPYLTILGSITKFN